MKAVSSFGVSKSRTSILVREFRTTRLLRRHAKSFSGLHLGMIANARGFRRRLGFAIASNSKNQGAFKIGRNVASVVFDLHPRIQIVEPKAVFGEIRFLE